MARKGGNRPSKVEYYLSIAEQVAKRSTCMRTRHGCVIVKNDQIVATGYTGAPRNVMDCAERGTCLRSELKIPSGQRYEICRSVHSEQNAIINAARAGVSLYDGTLFLFSLKVFEGKEKIINAMPCFICKKMVINAGIKTFVARQADGSFAVYDVKKWAKEWQKKDMLGDEKIYDSNYYKKKKKVEKKSRLIIGLTGGYCCGKGTVSDVLKENGFEYYLLSDIIRDIIRKKKQEITRDRMISVANKLRDKEGFGTLAARTNKKMKTDLVIVDSIRHPDEVKELRKNKNFFLVAVDASQKMRFKRMLSRDRGEKDPQTFKAFKEKDYLEMWGQTGSGQQIGKVIEQADIVMKNEGTMQELKKKTLRMLKDIEKKIQ